MSNTSPTYRAYTVIEREGQDDFWMAIGAAFKHEKGDGLNVILQALPLPNADGQCKIVLRPPKADNERPTSDTDNVQSLRTDNSKSRTRRG
jgi:hypothetical protein